MAEDRAAQPVYSSVQRRLARLYWGAVVGLSVWAAVDRMTDGALTGQACHMLRRARDAARNRWLDQRQFRRDVAWLLWDAIQIVEGEPADGD